MMMRVLTCLLTLTAVYCCIPYATARDAPQGALKSSSERAEVGVYQGAGCDGVRRLENFEQWFGRKPDRVLEFISWDVLRSGRTWGMRCWAKAGQVPVVFSLPMLPEDRNVTLADGAAGKFDDLFRNYATLLVKHGHGASTIRIGWEFNGNWYPWAASRDPQSWVIYWRRIVTAMRAVPGANFEFDWNPASTWSKLDAATVYPGDDYVDIIGLDVYNGGFTPQAVTPEQRWQERLKKRHGLNWHRDFARSRGKPMSYPEWGTGTRPDGSGGGDDPYFIEKMAEWIAANDVAYHNYWDYPASDYDARLSDGSKPRAAAAFIDAFSQRRAPPESAR